MSSRRSQTTSPISGEMGIDAVASKLFEHTGCSNMEEYVDLMKSQSLATVRNLRTGSITVTPKRQVRRLTFDRELVETLEPYVKEAIDCELGEYADVQIEKSHGDGLYYNGGEAGRHGWHVDEPPKTSPGKGYIYHSFILCLASNLSHEDDGATSVLVEGKKVSYPTNVPGNFLAFAATTPHMVQPVVARGGIPSNPWKYVTKDKRGRVTHIPMGGTSGEFVLKLKFDVWIRPYTIPIETGIGVDGAFAGAGGGGYDYDYAEDLYDDSMPWWEKEGYGSYTDACNGYEEDW